MHLAFLLTEYRKDGFRNMDDNDNLRQMGDVRNIALGRHPTFCLNF